MDHDGVDIRQTLIQAHNASLSGTVEFSHLITVVELPTGAKELIINTENIETKITYLLNTYDDNMCMRNNSMISVVGLMLVSK